MDKPALEVGILTISDSCASGQAEDLSGPAVEELAAAQGWKIAVKGSVADDASQIEPIVRQWCDLKAISVVLTTGGTGLGPRDVTPEAIRPLLDKELPGFGELMRQEGGKRTPLAALSRSLAGARRQSLIVCLPGSPSGARESLQALVELIPHAAAILSGAGHGSRRRKPKN